MLIIRLQRTGIKNKPSFRIVLAESYRAAGKQAIEVLGHYNPKRKDFAIKDPERLKYWLSQNVSVSPTVHNLLVEKKIVEGKKVKAWQPKKKEAPEGVSTTSPVKVEPAATPVAAEAAAAPAPSAGQPQA